MSPPFRFAVDVPLGKLARYLRMAGFDASYPNRRDRPHDFFMPIDPGRIIVTRTRSVRDRFQDRPMIFIHCNHPLRQLAQVTTDLQIRQSDIFPFTRCLDCNRQMAPTDREAVWGRVPPYIWHVHRRFTACGNCHRVYWAGSHRHRMVERLSAIWTPKEMRHHERHTPQKLS